MRSSESSRTPASTLSSASLALPTSPSPTRSPRGVATVEVPVDYQRGPVAPIEPALLDIPRRAPAPDEVRRAAEILAGARRPVIWFGSGVLAADAAPEACALAEALGAPVIT